MQHRLLLVLNLIVGLSVAAVGQHGGPTGGDCSYLAFEPFAYTAGQPLHQQSGGSGWQSPWVVQNDDALLPGYQTGAGASLAFGNLTVAGNHATGGRAYLTAGRRLDTAPDGAFADYTTAAQPYIGGRTDGSELWVSMLLQKNNDNNDELAVDLHSSEIVTCPQCPNT